MTSPFFAYLSRMKLIRRWCLMRSLADENIQEHSHRVAILAHALGTIGNTHFGKNWQPERAAFLGLLHDAGEVITGDMPTPVKYYDAAIRASYKALEKDANERLLSFLPENLRPAYRPALSPEEADEESWRLVRAADKLCAWLKCVEERRGGNKEFLLAEQAILKQLQAMEMEEVGWFIREFGPAFSLTLDELGEN